jgi:hypothetical protein
VIGLVLASLMTASLSTLLQWSPDEAAANAVLRRQKSRRDVLQAAADIVAFWWRKRHGGKMTRRQKQMARAPVVVTKLKRDLKRSKFKSRSELEDAMNMSRKLDSTKSRVAEMETTVDRIADELWFHDVHAVLAMHAEWEQDADPELAAFFKKMSSERGLTSSRHGVRTDSRKSTASATTHVSGDLAPQAGGFGRRGESRGAGGAGGAGGACGEQLSSVAEERRVGRAPPPLPPVQSGHVSSIPPY